MQSEKNINEVAEKLSSAYIHVLYIYYIRFSIEEKSTKIRNEHQCLYNGYNKYMSMSSPSIICTMYCTVYTKNVYHVLLIYFKIG